MPFLHSRRHLLDPMRAYASYGVAAAVHARSRHSAGTETPNARRRTTRERSWEETLPPAAPQSDGKAPEPSSHGAAHRFEQVRNIATTRWTEVTIGTLPGVLEDAYAACVQLSHRPRTQVLEGRPSRSRGQG